MYSTNDSADTRVHQALSCPRCKTDITAHPLYRRLRVCNVCGHHFSIPARERVEGLVDPHSFREFAATVHSNPLGAHRELREAVITGTARLAKHPIVLAVFDFGFRGGTMSVAVGEQITQAIEYATQKQLPFVAITATGGIRIQEGMPALLQMVKTTQAVKEFQNSGYPFIVVLCHPTTGGVYASFASLADIIFAEPGALIGFAGPRVAQALLRQELPVDSHRAESAHAHGMLDAIVPRTDLRNRLAQILSIITARDKNKVAPISADTDHARKPFSLSVSETIALARHINRPTALDYIHHLFTDFVELHGDRLHGDDPAVVSGLARFEKRSVVVIAQERGHGEEHHRGSAGPDGYRKAERVIHLAERLRLPIITLIDTPGADPGYASEQHGIANAIAHCLAALVQTPMPTLSVVIGEGTSGGALALAAADRVLMMENATYSIISPEGASAILFGDVSHTREIMGKLENRANDLLPRGVIDQVILEPEGGAHVQPDIAMSAVKVALKANLSQLETQNDKARLARRRARYRQAGSKDPIAPNR